MRNIVIALFCLLASPAFAQNVGLTLLGSYTAGHCTKINAGGFSLSDSGSACGGTGTVNSGTQYQLGYYATTGAAISGNSGILTDASNDLLVQTGNVGIGTTSPAFTLDLRGASGLATATSDYSFANFTGSAGRLYLGATTGNTYTILQGITGGGAGAGIVALNPGGGNVGIGTTGPASLLEIYGDGISSSARAATTAGTVSIGALASDFYSRPSYTGTYLLQGGSTATGTTSGIANASLGLLDFQNTNNALIMTNGGTPLEFATLSVERMRITATGNVGIGSTSPLVSLDLSQKTDAIALPYGSSATRPVLSSLNNGDIRYNSAGYVEYWNGSTWVSLEASGTSAGIYLGTGASYPNPAASASDTTTGLYTANAGEVDISGSGTQVASFTTGGLDLVSGKLTIGTTTPIELLTAEKADTTAYVSLSTTTAQPWTVGSGAVVQAYNTSSTSTDAAYLNLAATNASGNEQRAYVGAVSTAGSTTYAPSLAFGIQTGSTAYNEYMRIGTNGYVGVGTTSPTYPITIYDSSPGNMLYASDNNGTNISLTSDSSGRANLNVVGKAISSSNGGAYFSANGYQETFFTLITNANTSGERVMRFGNSSSTSAGNQANSFVIQSLNDAQSGVNYTPFIIQNNAPSNSFYIAGTTGNIGFGITSPKNKLDVYGGVAVGSTSGYAGAGTAPASGMIVAGSVGIGTTSPLTNAILTLAGHLGFTGTAPTISSCGGGTLVTGSQDNKGSITGITAATACTITFGATMPTAPACTFSDSAATAVGISAISTTAVTATMSSLTGTLYYLCF